MSKIISKCKNDKPRKNQVEKVPAPPQSSRRPSSAPYFHHLFQFFRSPSPRESIKIHPLPPPLQKEGAQHMNTHIGSSKVKVKFPET